MITGCRRRSGRRFHRRLGLVPCERRDLRRCCGRRWSDPALSRRRRLAWRLIFAALVLDIVASVGWGYSALTENVTFGSWPDVLYIFYYPLAAVAFVLFYLDLGGRAEHHARVIDFTTRGDRLRIAAVVHRARAASRHCRAPSSLEQLVGGRATASAMRSR